MKREARHGRGPCRDVLFCHRKILHSRSHKQRKRVLTRDNEIPRCVQVDTRAKARPARHRIRGTAAKFGISSHARGTNGQHRFDPTRAAVTSIRTVVSRGHNHRNATLHQLLRGCTQPGYKNTHIMSCHILLVGAFNANDKHNHSIDFCLRYSPLSKGCQICPPILS